MKSRILFAVAFAASLLAGGAVAQQQQQQEIQPTVNKPYGDWSVRCFPVSSPAPCDLFESLGNKETNRRVLSISVAFIPSNGRHIIRIAVPLGVSLQKGGKIVASAYTSPPLFFRRCDRGGCYIEGLIDDNSINALKRSAAQAHLNVTPYGGGKEVAIPLSLKGFSAGHAEMVNLARQKASSGNTSAPAPTAPAEGGATPTP